MKISDLAQQTGVSSDTIRYYEKIGLLPEPARNLNNYRVYSAEHVKYLRFIKNCRQLDMTQEEIARLLHLAISPFEPCDEINQLLDEHLGHVQERIQELQQVEVVLSKLREQCLHPKQVQDCGILEGLNSIAAWQDSSTSKPITACMRN